MTATEPRLTPDELRELFLFENLTPEQLDWVSANGDVVDCPAGTDAAVEGEPAECFFVLLAGTMSMVRHGRRRRGRDRAQLEPRRVLRRGPVLLR